MNNLCIKCTLYFIFLLSQSQYLPDYYSYKAPHWRTENYALGRLGILSNPETKSPYAFVQSEGQNKWTTEVRLWFQNRTSR